MINDNLTDRDLYMYRREVMREYLRQHSSVSVEIHQKLNEWIRSGHDVHDNPWGLYNHKTGVPYDYLEAMKIISLLPK